MENIYLTRFTMKDSRDEIKKKIEILFNKAELNKVLEGNDLTAVKVHFGEEGNSTFVPADLIAPIVSEIKKIGAKPFVTDTNVLYKSKRDNAYDHLNLAREHGFTNESLGAPVIIADGIAGRNEMEIEINAPMNKTVSIASDYVTANSLIVVTHVTGHLATGMGATIKNLGMGMASRKGKLRQHSVSKPIIDKNKCSACGKCVDWCPPDCITLHDNYAEINEGMCIGCGECLAVCRTDAVKFRWDAGSSDLQKQIAEHALGITSIKQGKMGYMTFLVNMTKDCDCLPQKAAYVVSDIGLIAGKDPVAMDQAALDLTANAGNNVSTLSYPKLDPTIQLSYGETLGLGSRAYKLVEI